MRGTRGIQWFFIFERLNKNCKKTKKVLTLWQARGIIIFVAKKSDKDEKEFKKIRKKLLTKTG